MYKFITAILLFLSVNSFAWATPKTDFESALNSIKFLLDHYTIDKSYEKWEFIDKKTKEKKQFKDFTEMERKIFFLMRGQKIDTDLSSLWSAWLKEIESAVEQTEDMNEATKEDVKGYMEKLRYLRKLNAKKVEDTLKEIFKKWPDKFTDEEKEFLKKTIEETHDKDKLIER